MSTLFITVSFPQKQRSLLTKCESLDEIFAWSQFIKRVNAYIVFRLVSALHTNKRNLMPWIWWNVIEVHLCCRNKRSDIDWKTVNFNWERKGYSYIKMWKTVLPFTYCQDTQESLALQHIHPNILLWYGFNSWVRFRNSNRFHLLSKKDGLRGHTHFHMITVCISILSPIRCVTDLRLQDRGVCAFLYHDMLLCRLNFKRKKRLVMEQL